MKLYSFQDIFLILIYMIIIIVFSYIIKNKFVKKYEEYKYFQTGLILKLLGVSGFILIYLFYYGGGDTVSYFKGTRALSNLLIYDFDKGLSVLLDLSDPNNSFRSFNQNTGYPPYYMWKDPSTFMVCRLTVPLFFLVSGSFIITSFLVSIFSYIGIWKFYRLFNILYPGYHKQFAYLILFVPSLLFWGSGIMKDSYVLSATCWISYNFYKVFIQRRKIIFNAVLLVFNLILILNIKSYILISLIPGMLLWLNNTYLQSIRNPFFRPLIFPVILIFISFLGFYTFQNISTFMGVYGDVDSAIQKLKLFKEIY